METIDVKRLYLPGQVIKSKCPKCGTERIQDLEGEYLSFPPMNEWFDHGMYCRECDTEWDVRVKLSVNVKHKEINK